MSAQNDTLVRDLYTLVAGKERVSADRVRALLEPHLPDRYSVCPIDGAPLVSSLEVKFKEWVCEACGNYYAMFGVPTKAATPALHRRYWDFCDLSRQRRSKASS